MNSGTENVQRIALAILSKELIRLKSLCLKAADHVVVGDDETLNLKNALTFKSTPNYTRDYTELQEESAFVADELEKLYGPLNSSLGSYADILEQELKDEE